MHKHAACLAITVAVALFISFAAFAQMPPAPRVVDLKTADGLRLKATVFAAAKPGPGVLLLHQVNRDRRSWEGVAAQLASAGINRLTLDTRGIGESGGTRWEKLTDTDFAKHWRGWPQDILPR